MTVYLVIFTITAVVLNVAFLRNVKQQPQNSCVPQAQVLNSDLTKIIIITVTTLVTTYLPLLITLFVAINAVNFANKQLFKLMRNVFIWTLIPLQINAVLNSVIYLARNKCMRR